MKKFFTLLILTILLIPTKLVLSGNQEQPVITDQLKQKIDVSLNGEMIRINISLKDQFDSQKLLNQVKTMSKTERRAHVINVLKDFSDLSQKGVIADLNSLQQSGKVRQVTTLWIANIVNCFATAEAIAELAKRTEIGGIDYDEYRVLIDPSESENVYYEEGFSGSREVTWNIIKINADDVWALGFNGAGIIVAVIDTGVNYNHVDLADHVWMSDDYPNHGFDFANNDNNPMDDHGHGTHCAGTVAGDGTAGSQTGVAPEATIMCCKVLDAGGGGTESGVWAAVQFSVEQGADVMSLSLGWQHSWGADRASWRAAFDNSLAAGLIASVAAGNEGDQQGSYPIPDNVRTPGDLPPAWLHPDQTLTGGVSGIICVGATDVNDNLAGFSSRGPMDWSAISPYNDYPYQPEMGLIRPDICAPGVNIKSLDYSSNTGYASGWSGTSMATPANAGVIALMLSKNDLLTPEQIDQTIEETAVVLVAGKNNNSGSGRVDALGAVNETAMPGPSYYSHILNDAAGNNNGIINPGEHIMLTLSMANFSDVPVNDVTVTLSISSPSITITDNSEYFGNFALNQIKNIPNAFTFDVAGDIPGGELIQFVLTASTPTESWQSGFEATAEGISFSLGEFVISDYSGNNNGQLDPGETVDILIQTSNLGQMDANNTLGILSSPNSEITINSAEYPFGTIASGQTLTALFNITVSETTPIGTIVELNYDVTSGDYNLSAQFFLAVGLIIEDFETGDFTMYDWQTAGSSPWTIVPDEKYEGEYSAKSGAIGNNQTSEMTLTMIVANDDSIAYFRKTSSQTNFDFLHFFVDEVLWDEVSGETNWERVAIPLTPGLHILKWVYVKNGNTSSGSDCAWVDYIDLPASVPLVNVNAGEDAAICESVGFQTVATAENYNNVLWETTGNGSFDDITMLNAMYFPSQDDYDNTFVTLSLTAYGPVDQTVTDDLVLNFLPYPGLVGPISGLTIVCMDGNNSYSIEAVANADSYLWNLTPADAGVISGEGLDITIQWAEGWIGQASLSAHGLNECGAGTNVENLIIQVDNCTGIDQLLSESGLKITPNPNNGSFNLEISDFPTAGSQIVIMNLMGEKVFETILSGKKHEAIRATDLKNGIYFIKIVNGGESITEKLIIQR